MNFGVIVFPGSNCDEDCRYVLGEVLGQKVRKVWHKERNLSGLDCVVLPGGFSYGDYLRSGAIARFSPVMKAVVLHAKKGKPVIGICNGFQILLEAGLLPGAMLRNTTLHFICRAVHMRVESSETPFTGVLEKGAVLTLPIAHNEGNYFADPETLDSLEQHHQIVFRYCDPEGAVNDAVNPNGSIGNIAGICNRKRNVLGLMPHPERASESILNSTDGRKIFESLMSV